MNERWIPAALNLFTLIGGHIYNKRYDRALVFITALITWYILAWFGFIFLLPNMGDVSFERFSSYSLRSYLLFQVAGFAVIFVVSSVTSFVDYNNTNDSISKKSKWITATAGVLISIYAVFVFFGQAFTLFSFENHKHRSKAKSSSGKVANSSSVFSYSSDSFFLNGISYKAYEPLFRDDSLPGPPVGSAKIAGEFLLDGQPVPNITFDMVLDSKYRAKQITTDENGLFSIPIQPGTWHVDYVHVNKWENKPPDRELLMVSGREGKLMGTRFNEHNYFEFNKGLPVEATSDSQKHVTIKLADKLQLLQPQKNSTREEVSTADYSIRWESYPGAKHYLVKISEITHKGSSTSYHPVANRKVTDVTQLALADLKTVDHSEDPFEYQVKVFAFDESNNFLSESNDGFNSSRILLMNGKKIIDNDASRMFGGSQSFNEKEFKEMRNNTKRLDAAEILIQEKMFGEAKKLLEKVKGKTEPGKKDAITGYLLAEQNQCKKAQEYFDRAKKDNPKMCLPECYSKNCN